MSYDGEARRRHNESALPTAEVWPLRRSVVEGCPTCDRYVHGIMPPHDASSRCESGKHPHCTCDTCF